MDSSVNRKGALIASACTAVQAGAWFILSLVGLLSAVDVITPRNSEEIIEDIKPTEIFPRDILMCYFQISDSEDTCCSKLVLPGKGMLAASVIYIIASLAWLCVSALLINDLNGSRKHLELLTQIWAGVTIATCILDSIFVIIFGVDYAHLSSLDGYCYNFLTVSGFLMSLTARGYVLWLLNLVAAIWLLQVAKRMGGRRNSRADSDNDSYYNDPQDALGVQDSRSMIFRGGVDRSWAGKDPRNPVASGKPLGAWDSADGDAFSRQDQRSPGPLGATISSQRGGLAQRMAQPPPAQDSGYGQLRSPAMAMTPRALSQPPFPTPDYDSRPPPNSQPPKPPPQPRSALKKPPAITVPSPGVNHQSTGGLNDWRQQVQQPDDRWQQGGYGGGGGGGGGGFGGGFGAGGGGRGYDNRGYEGGRGRTGF